MAVADKTEVRWVDDWVRALGSFQKQSYAIDKSIWKPSGVRKRIPLWKPSTGFAQVCWTTNDSICEFSLILHENRNSWRIEI